VKNSFTTEAQRPTESTGSTEEETKQNVIPAKAGIHLAGNAPVDKWIPAFAGMTTFE
jgi:hypothetical protein